MSGEATDRFGPYGDRLDALLFAAARVWLLEHPDETDANYATSRNRFLYAAEAAYLRLLPLQLAATDDEKDVGPVPEKGRHVVYRARDVNGDLIYVGMSSNFPLRLYAHRRASDWWGFMETLDIEEFASREAAAEAEMTAITEEQPVWNRIGIRGMRDPVGLRQ